MKERIDKLEQKYMDWRNHGTKAFEKATSEKMPVFTRKADEEIAKLKARIAELETLIRLTVDDLRMRSDDDVVNISDFIWQQLKEAIK